MPAVSKRQQRYMAMCSTPKGRKKAKGKCPPVSVAKEFMSYSSKFHNPHAKKRKYH